jgi:hypothetical protein
MNVAGGFRQHRQVFVLALAKAGAVAGLSLALLLPAGAQFWGQWDARQPRQQQQRQPQQQQPQQQQQEFNPFGGWFGAPQNRPRRDQQRDSAPDYSRAPSAQRKGEGAAIPIVVMGDGMADWLAYGLEDAFVMTPSATISSGRRWCARASRRTGRNSS